VDVMRKIEFYRTVSGQNPIENFLDQLPAKSAQKVTWVLKLVEDLDKVPSKYFKKLVNTQDLWEVRASAGSNIFRLIGFFDGPNIVVVAHGFQKRPKKHQKEPLKLLKIEKKTILGGK
jgi:phage-related protein